ncbi:poly [ADP-ribose] polymerase tankyrase-2-like [Saccostrea echinata]|uniref:poly [ADP-ribose] polymerase tankyrase-2-like n=1 Tax=Saccostrea echinata TaxID=191078 RepID=UPI002A81A134|nr:poly [ADP-ribose] polymerase tankyrase-2-like [Saccostrea echinata]
MSTKRKQVDSIKQQAINILSMMRKQDNKLEDKMKKFVKKDKAIARRTFETDVEGWTPVHACVMKGSKHLLKVMIGTGIPVNFRMGQPEGLPGECSLLHIAAYRGDVKICKYLISHGACVDARDNYNRAPMYYAQTKQHNRVIELLKQKGGDQTVDNTDTDIMMMDECPTPQPTKLGFCFSPFMKS